MKKPSLIKIIFWLIILVISGRISFDLNIWINIPITGQSLAVILSGYFLSYTEIVILYFLYLGGGAANLPFFADGSGGFHVLTGKSGGYLYSFPLAAMVVSYIKSPHLNNISTLISFLLATALILFIGMLHLAYSIGISSAWTYGVVPYVVGGLIKCLIAFVVIRTMKWFTNMLIPM